MKSFFFFQNIKRYVKLLVSSCIWGKVFKNGPSKVYGRQPLKNLKRYGLFKQTIFLQFFKGCLTQIVLGPFLNTFSHFNEVRAHIRNHLYIRTQNFAAN